MAERFGDIEHINRLYSLNSEDYEKTRIENTHGGEDYSPEWVVNKVEIKLCNVPWDDEYKNTIDWLNYDKSHYFDNLSGRVLDLTSSWNLKKLEVFKPSLNGYVGEVDVPITFEEALLFNYVYVKQYRQHTTRGEYIEDFYFFVSSFEKIAPNTTRLNIHNDIWTQYLHHFENRYMMLERGHYPHYLVETSDYFENPSDCVVDITEPEPDLDSVKHHNSFNEFYALDDELRCVIVSGVNLAASNFTAYSSRFWEDYSKIPTSAASGQWRGEPKTFQPLNNGSTITDFVVLDTNFNSVASIQQPAVKYSEDFHDVTGQLYCYSFPCDDLDSFMIDANKRVPFVLPHIKAIYAIPAKYVSNGISTTIIGGVEAVHITPSTQLDELKVLNFTPQDFGYDNTEYAKLFTSQFALIRISNLAGESVDLGFEDFTDNVVVNARASTVFPFLKLDTFISGLNRDSDISYKISNFTDISAKIFGGDFEATRLEYDIPIYGLYASGDVTNATKYISYAQARENTLRDNQNARVDAENSYYTALNNLLREESQSKLSSQSSKIVGDNSNTTQKAISDRSATTARNNSSATNATNNTNTNSDIATADTIAKENFEFAHEQQQRNIDNQFYFQNTLDRYYDVKPISQQLDWSTARKGWKIGFNTALAAAGGGVHAMWNGVSALIKSRSADNTGSTRESAQEAEKPLNAQIGKSAGSPIGGGEVSGGSPAGGDILAAAQTAAQVALNAAYMNTCIEWDEEEKRWTRDFMREQNDKYATETRTFNEDQNDFLLEKSHSVNDKDIANRYAHESRRFNNEAGVISNTYNTDIANNSDTYNTTASNINRIYDTEITNTNHTRAVAEQNTQNGYDIALVKLENNVISTTHNQDSEIKTNKLNPLQQYGEFSGDNFNFVENGYSGVSVKIFTISKAQVARAVLTFNRYGYRVGSGVVVNNLKRYSLFSSHTYWQANECYGVIDGNETAASFMRHIFNNGVTVWTNPENIYDYSHNERITNAI